MTVLFLKSNQLHEEFTADDLSNTFLEALVCQVNFSELLFFWGLDDIFYHNARVNHLGNRL